MAESSFNPLDAIEGYQEDTGENEISAFLRNLALDESDAEGEYNDLKSNITDREKRLSGILISDPDNSGIDEGENAANAEKNITRKPKKSGNIINEPEASLNPGDSCDPRNTKLEKNRNESNNNTEDLARTLKRALSAGAVRSRNKISSLDNKVDNVKEEMREVKREMKQMEKEMEELRKEMKEVKNENGLLRIAIARMQQRMTANVETQ
ncbi:uncharacterized protein [Diadema setosum]|uniref:uncharacterized protein n=1 Tax=Diadema setosum TaxID=31175 RepID=UPI003B3BE2EF